MNRSYLESKREIITGYFMFSFVILKICGFHYISDNFV